MGLHTANQTSFKKGEKAPNWNGFKKGLIPWNKGMTFNEKETARWKGDRVGYFGLHAWVRKYLGKAKMCEFCLKDYGAIDWANKSQQYKRDLNDWLSLCRSCHKKYDYGTSKRKCDETGRFIQ